MHTRTILRMGLLVWLMAHSVCCQAEGRNYQIEDGLSYNSVWCLCQDHKGFLWLGTNEGLNRFDGNNFKVYQRHPNAPKSLGNNFVHAIYETSDRRLLIGTRKGLLRYNREQDDFTAIPLTDHASTEINVNDIKEDNAGNIWIASHGNGLFCLSRQLKVTQHFIQGKEAGMLPSNFLWTIAIDGHNNLWIGTAGSGICLWDAHTRKFVSYTQCGNISLNGQSIYSIFPDNDGTLWIGTSSLGLLHYKPVDNMVRNMLVNTPNIKAIRHYRPQQLVMGTENGPVLIDKQTGSLLPIEGLEGQEENYNSVFDILKDMDGGLWVATYFSGVNYLLPPTDKEIRSIVMDHKGPANMVVSSITETPQGHILLATHNDNCIYQYTPSSGKVSPIFQVEYANVQNIVCHRGELYVAMAGRGIDVYALPTSQKVRHIKHNLAEGLSMFPLAGGALVFALEEGGAIYLSASKEEMKLKELDKVLINGVIQDQRGTIWFSTYNNGLFAWSKDGLWRNIKTLQQGKETISLFGMTGITNVGDQLWLGTKEQGMLKVDLEKLAVVKSIDASTGLFSNAIYSLTHDAAGNLWACTKDNIVKIEPKSDKLRFMGHQDRNTPSNLHHSLCASDGMLYFAGTKGFYVVNPHLTTEKKRNGCIMLTRFLVNYHEVRPGGTDSPLGSSIEGCTEVTLKNNQNNFTIEFALLDFTSPKENIYRYRMDGLDQEWIYTQHPMANYMNLPAGRYTFHVCGSKGDGNWSQERTLVFIIKPPFWRSTTMLVIYLLLTVILTVLGIWYYNHYLRQRQLAMQKEFQIAQEHELYEQKISFFTNIAHEIRTPLSLISGPLENILRKQDISEHTRHHLETIQRNTTRLLTLVSQLLDFRKIENDMFQLNIRYQNIQGIIQRVYEQYIPEAEANGIRLSLKMPKDSVLAFVDAEALYKIVSNLLSNALKFCSSAIQIEMTTGENCVHISVSDDGKGIKEEDRKNIFEPFYQANGVADQRRGSGLGLSLSKSLSLKMRGNLTVSNLSAGGAHFMLTLPAMIEPEQRFQSLVAEETAKGNQQHADKELPCILIVEDNKDLADFISETLSETYSVLTAENGQEALKMVEQYDVDIIISDVMMPVMDGLELCNRLRNNHDYSHLPIILLSAKTDTETKVKGIKQGADVYLEKPFSVEQLRVQVETILQKRAQLQQRFIESPLDYYKKVPKTDENATFIEELNKEILEHMSDRDFNVEVLVRIFATNRTNFQKKLKSITGLTPNDYIRLIRLNKSAELLATGKYRINEVCAIVGFNSPSYFSKCFNEQFGRLPKDFV